MVMNQNQSWCLSKEKKIKNGLWINLVLLVGQAMRECGAEIVGDDGVHQLPPNEQQQQPHVIEQRPANALFVRRRIER